MCPINGMDDGLVVARDCRKCMLCATKYASVRFVGMGFFFFPNGYEKFGEEKFDGFLLLWSMQLKLVYQHVSIKIYISRRISLRRWKKEKEKEVELSDVKYHNQKSNIQRDHFQMFVIKYQSWNISVSKRHYQKHQLPNNNSNISILECQVRYVSHNVNWKSGNMGSPSSVLCKGSHSELTFRPCPILIIGAFVFFSRKKKKS